LGDPVAVLGQPRLPLRRHLLAPVGELAAVSICIDDVIAETTHGSASLKVKSVRQDVLTCGRADVLTCARLVTERTHVHTSARQHVFSPCQLGLHYRASIANTPRARCPARRSSSAASKSSSA